MENLIDTFCESNKNFCCQPDLLQLVASGHVETSTGVGEDEARDSNVVVAPHCRHLQVHCYDGKQKARYLHLALQVRQGVG